jgi:hypothetical protein
VLMHSQVFEYFTLMTSGEFGLEREALQVLDVENFPIIIPEKLSRAERALVEHAADGLLSDQPNWEKLDQAVQKIYGIGPLDAEAVADALSTRSPFPVAKKLACTPVSPLWAERFRTRLQNELVGVLGANGHQVHVQLLSDHAHLPWKFIAVSLDAQALPATPPANWIEHADDLAVSRITIIDSKRPLIVIGLLDRSRYWTPTQARLLASDIIWEQGATLEERAGR